MNNSVQTISLLNLSIAFIPVAVVIAIHYRWSLDYGNVVYAYGRMLVQLMIIGYFLVFIFNADNAWIIVGVLATMVFISSWISLRTVKENRKELYKDAFLSIFIAGGFCLLLIVFGILKLDPWYEPRYLVPLAGMVFANSMNSVSLAAERLKGEMDKGVEYVEARGVAYKASLIPFVNMLFAVGLVAIPGMMTGQILSGVSPLIAARYQIMIMCVVVGSAGIASALFLTFMKDKFSPKA